MSCTIFCTNHLLVAGRDIAEKTGNCYKLRKMFKLNHSSKQKMVSASAGDIKKESFP